MNNRLISILLLCMAFVVTAQMPLTKPEKLVDRKLYNDKYIAGHEYVDLGLPSGLKWATCNIGADFPEECGYYYAWGEIERKPQYYYKNCETHKKTLEWLKSERYIDNKCNLMAFHDPATAMWGGTWRMPTKAEMEELIANTTAKWTTVDGVKGRLFKSKINGNTIFFPAVGYRESWGKYKEDEGGFYWLATAKDDNEVTKYKVKEKDKNKKAYRFILFNNTVSVGANYRYLGHCIRPISQ